MNDVKRLEIKINKIKKEKRERRMWFLVLLIAVSTISIVIMYNHELKNELQQTVAYAEETKVDEMSHVHELTVTERDLVERVVAAEARGENFQGQMAVAQVIRDRCRLWNKSVEEVLSEPNQFAAPYEGEISGTTEASVGLVFEGGHDIFDVPVTHFYAHDLIEEPEWAKEMFFIESIGGHSFYAERN